MIIEDVREDSKSGIQAQKEEIEDIESKADKQKSIIAEDTLPKKKRGKSIQIEESITVVELEDQPTQVEVKTASRRKSSKGKSLEIQEVEMIETKIEPQTPTEVIVEKKLKRGISASKEEVIISDEPERSKPKESKIEILEEVSSQKGFVATKVEVVVEEGSKRRESKIEVIEEFKPHKASLATKDDIIEVENEVASNKRKDSQIKIIDDKADTAVLASKEEIVQEKNASSKRKQSKVEALDESPKKAVPATKEDVVEVEMNGDQLNRRKSKVEALEKDEPQRGKSAIKEEAVDVENDVAKSRRKSSKIGTVEEELPQKAIKIEDEEIDEDVENLLRRAKKQRSLIEEIKVVEDKIEAPEGIVIDFTKKKKKKQNTIGCTSTFTTSPSILERTTRASENYYVTKTLTYYTHCRATYP